MDELPLLFSLLAYPLILGSLGDNETSESLLMSPGSANDVSSNVSKLFTVDTVKSLSWKKVRGFLHVIEDILAVFDETHLNPFFNLLMNCIGRILASCTSSLEITNDGSLSSSKNCLSLDVNVDEHDKDTEDGIAVSNVLYLLLLVYCWSLLIIVVYFVFLCFCFSIGRLSGNPFTQ